MLFIYYDDVFFASDDAFFTLWALFFVKYVVSNKTVRYYYRKERKKERCDDWNYFKIRNAVS